MRGPQNALRYSNNEEATRETFQDGLVQFASSSTSEFATDNQCLFDRWVRTGDEVVFNEKGDMFIVDRKKVNSDPS